ncbi:MBL fold metallo-hydrolase [Vibrio profundum]|uniref:MBL fold metallo-hydrolase n=1 Tax=Vibrio profundum TaxID=2910247 RepID=UPI003D0BF507
MSRKKIIWISFSVVLMLIIGFMAPIASRLPIAQADRIDGKNLVGIDAGGSFTWVIPTQTGVALIDSGWDSDAKALKEEIGDRKVHAILITHGHFDHTGGLPFFPDAVVYIAPGEGPLLKGEAKAKGWMARMSTFMMSPQPYSPRHLKEFKDGDVIEIDGEQFKAIHMPGHTQGSAMYLWKDVLFTGDTIVGRGGYVNEIPKPTYADYNAVRGNVSQVLVYPFDRIADGHVGLHMNAYQQVKVYLEE